MRTKTKKLYNASDHTFQHSLWPFYSQNCHLQQHLAATSQLLIDPHLRGHYPLVGRSISLLVIWLGSIKCNVLFGFFVLVSLFGLACDLFARTNMDFPMYLKILVYHEIIIYGIWAMIGSLFTFVGAFSKFFDPSLVSSKNLTSVARSESWEMVTLVKSWAGNASISPGRP